MAEEIEKVELRLPRMNAGGSDRLPLSGFRLRDYRFTVRGQNLRAVSGDPSTIRAIRYGGTDTMTMPASPATDVDSPYGVPMSSPATLRTHIVAVICLVAMETRWARLAGIGRVYPFHRNTRPLGFVGNERGELVERPGGHHAVVFAGVRPTACACRALAGSVADTSELFHADDAHTLLVSMGDDLMREFVVGVAHPALLFALTLADSANLSGLLKVLAVSVELAAFRSLHPTIADVASAAPDDMHHGGHLDAQVYPHDALAGCWLRLRQRVRDFRHPLAPLALDAQQSRRPRWRAWSAPDTDLLHLAVLAHGNQQAITFYAPVLVIPLANGLAQDRKHTEHERAVPERARIPKRLILDGAGERSDEVLGTDALPSIGQHIAIQGSHQHVDRADVLLAVRPQDGGLFRRWVEPDRHRGLQLAHVLDCLSMYF